MKKEIFSISEKHERITIRYKRKQKTLFAKCDNCGKRVNWMTLIDAADLSEKSPEEILNELKILSKTK